MGTAAAARKKAVYGPGPLFGDTDAPPQGETPARARQMAGRAVIAQLRAVQRQLDTAEKASFTESIDELIQRIADRARLTDTQRQGLVLLAIEEKGANTPIEIGELCRFTLEETKVLTDEMLESGLIYRVRRLVIGSDRPQFALKSSRIRTPEVLDNVIRPAKSVWRSIEDACG
jgi:hypothetical protein